MPTIERCPADALAGRGDGSGPSQLPDVSIVVPTYREAPNVAPLTRRIFTSMESAGVKAEVIFVDDDSRDGIEEECRVFARTHDVRLLVRRGERGLATAVLHGFAHARAPMLVCMDADLSHPPEAIPKMLEALRVGAEFVIGSRYVEGGRVDDGWGLHRRLNSRIAMLLAAPLCHVRDPLAGFFALPRDVLARAPAISPVGYKIGLELLVKCRPRRVVEIPIRFVDRAVGDSKLSPLVQIEYLVHLGRLYRHRFPLLGEIASFVAVGGLGLAADVLVYMALQAQLGFHHVVARSLAFLWASSQNWLLNRHLTFASGRERAPVGQWASYLSVTLLSFGLSVGTYAALTTLTAIFARRRYLALLVGIVLASTVNFTLARFHVFRPRRPGRGPCYRFRAVGRHG